MRTGKTIVKYLTQRQYNKFKRGKAVRVLIEGTFYIFRPKEEDRALQRKIDRLKKELREAKMEAHKKKTGRADG
jgi:hypothetical protein